MKTVTGIGYDVHPLIRGEKLILGGIHMPFPSGLKSFSDGDVLTHAIIDALLGAGSLGDIGEHFPPHNEKYRNISSVLLLQQVRKLLEKHKFQINNIDVIIVAENPKLTAYKKPIRENIASALKTGNKNINIKATTTEGLGFTGTSKGISCYAIATLRIKTNV